MQYSIESIRDDIATLVGDDGSILHTSVTDLPPKSCTGTVLQQQPDGSFTAQLQVTTRRSAHALALFRKLKRTEYR